MATHMIDRSTWWVNSGGSNPINTGDYRHFWSISYTTDKANRKTNFTVDYYVQYCFSAYEAGAQMDYLYEVPSGTSTVYINGSSIGSISTPKLEIEKASGWRTKYVGTRTFSIKHNNDGSASFKFYGTGFGKGTSTSEYSTANGNFANIPSQSILDSISTFDIDAGITSISFKKYVDGYYHTLQIYKDSNIFKTIDGFDSGEPITFTEAELDDIYTKIPKGNSATFSFKLTTYTNSNKTSVVGTDTKTATGNFTIALPTVKGAVCEDIVIGTVEVTGDTTRQTIIKDYSHIVVKIPTSMHAVANTRKATIVEYVIEDKNVEYNASGNTVYLDERDENNNIVHGSDVKYTQKDHIIIYAVDSRGTSSQPFVQKFTKYIPYENLSINNKKSTISRDNGGVGRQVTLSFEGTWWDDSFGAVENALEIFVYYRNAEDGHWTDLNDFLEGASAGSLDTSLLDTSENGVFKYNGPVMSNEQDKGFNVRYPYDVLVIIYDKIKGALLGITVEYGEPAIAVYKNKAALGGPYDESLGGTQLWGDIYVNGEPHGSGGSSAVDAKRHAISAYLATPDTRSYTAWTTYRTRLNAYTSVGDKLTFDANNNYIVVGPGVSKVKVSGCAYFCGKKSEDSSNSDYNVTLPSTQLRVWCTTYNAEGGAIDSTPAYHHHTNVNTNESVVVTEKIFSVEEGWRIDMCTQIGITSTATLVAKGTVLYVEVME